MFLARNFFLCNRVFHATKFRCMKKQNICNRNFSASIFHLPRNIAIAISMHRNFHVSKHCNLPQNIAIRHAWNTAIFMQFVASIASPSQFSCLETSPSQLSKLQLRNIRQLEAVGIYGINFIRHNFCSNSFSIANSNRHAWNTAIFMQFVVSIASPPQFSCLETSQSQFFCNCAI